MTEVVVRMEIGGNDYELGAIMAEREIRVRVRVLREERKREGGNNEGVAGVERTAWSSGNGGERK